MGCCRKGRGHMPAAMCCRCHPKPEVCGACRNPSRIRPAAHLCSQRMPHAPRCAPAPAQQDEQAGVMWQPQCNACLSLETSGHRCKSRAPSMSNPASMVQQWSVSLAGVTGQGHERAWGCFPAAGRAHLAVDAVAAGGGDGANLVRGVCRQGRHLVRLHWTGRALPAALRCTCH